MRPRGSTVLLRPSVVLLAVGALVALVMVALSAGPSSGKENCEGDFEDTGEEVCTGGGSADGTGTGGGGEREVQEFDPESGTVSIVISGGRGRGTSTSETTTAGSGGRLTFTDSGEEGVSGTYSGTSHGSKGGGRCTFDSSDEEPQCVGSPGFETGF